MNINRATSTFDERIEALTDKHDKLIRTQDIIDIVKSMLSTVSADMHASLQTVGVEIASLVDLIGTTKNEIASIQPHALSSSGIPDAKDQLDAVVLDTEQAAGKIMDCADDLMALSTGLAPELQGKLQSLSTRIYEASSFQDINGQRVTKVVRLLKDIEQKLAQLAVAFGDTKDPNLFAAENNGLLNGPQLQPADNLQDNIDSLFASLN